MEQQSSLRYGITGSQKHSTYVHRVQMVVRFDGEYIAHCIYVLALYTVSVPDTPT